MLVLVKTSAACLLFMLYMIGFYYRKPHIPIKSTRIFQWLIAVAVVNSSFDLITICTVNHRDLVPDSANLTAHIVYLLSILGYIYLLFLYNGHTHHILHLLFHQFGIPNMVQEFHL